MKYVIVAKDKVVRYDDIYDGNKTSSTTSLLFFMPYDDWKLLIGEISEDKTFQELETDYIKSRGWTKQDNESDIL